MKPAQTLALMLAAAIFGYGMAPEPQPAVQAAPVVVGSPPGVESQLRSELAAMRSELEDAKESLAVAHKELLAARCQNTTSTGCGDACKCPGDGRCAAGECKSSGGVFAQNCAQGNCTSSGPVFSAPVYYQPQRRFRIFGRR